MRFALLTIFGWLLRALAVLAALASAVGAQFAYTHPDPVDAELMASASGRLGYFLGLALVAIFLVTIYAIGSKLLRLRNKAVRTTISSTVTPEG